MSFSLDEEVRLYTIKTEREKYETLATLFGILTSIHYLEAAYMRDAITAAEYTPACTRLLSQYNTIMKQKIVRDEVGSNVEEFMKRYRMDSSAALERVKVGVPATVEHPGDSGMSGPETAKWVAETTESFITFMDALKLNLRAKDQLHPLLQNVVTGYARFKNTGQGDGEARSRLVGWLITLNGMSASETISEEQSRQLSFDVEHAYSEFFRSLSGKGG
ncbi:vps28 protein [Moniliophthora roreri MCA 2997]|uniref:Vacuolar protein sorting-associated protein 28 n=2 Tax=Moniliophthora roreri TaxID=221103 RepID=V2WP31_MONRO|nr:vps28 protein [Moniliophthora roreri MCA 2997]KAI3605036.1 vps28 protein [Moniliophthora roreri]